MIIDLTEDEENPKTQAAQGAIGTTPFTPLLPPISNITHVSNNPHIPLSSNANSIYPQPIPLANSTPHQLVLQNYLAAQQVTQQSNSSYPMMPSNYPYFQNMHRALPATVLSNTANAPLQQPSLSHPSHSSTASYRVLPSTLVPQTAPSSAYEVNMAARNAVTNTVSNNRVGVIVEPLHIRFSVIDHQSFTARAETGRVTAPIIECLKRTPGAKFDKSTSRWLFPFSSHQILYHALQKNRCSIESVPPGIIAAAQLKTRIGAGDSSSSAAATSSEIDFLTPLLGEKVLANLAPFQQDAVKFIHEKKGRALIADEMGLGKTRTAIGGAMLYQDNWPVLVVCPSSARFHWQSELLTVLSPEIVDAREITVVENGQHSVISTSSQYSYKFVIISYALVAKLQDRLLQSKFGVVIADESHYLKTRKAQRTKALLPLIHHAKCALLLSGTPALSRPVELFTQLHALLPQQWNDFKAFGKRYCVDPRPSNEKSLYNSHNRFSYGENAFKGANNTQELHVILTSTIMIRRLKRDILKQLPQKKRYLIKVGIEDEAAKRNFRSILSKLSQYEELLKKKKATISQRKRGRGASTIEDNINVDDPNEDDDDVVDPLEDAKKKRKSLLMELFRDSGIAKAPAILKQLERFLDVDSSGKVLVFAHHRNVLDHICQFLRRKDVEFIRIDGMTQSSERHQRTQQFQTDPKIRVAVLGITAAGIALTLTAAHIVFFAEMFWTPGSLIQAEDRAHRIGQVRDVKIFYFFAESSIDELLWPLVRKKLQLLGEIVEGKSGLDLAAQMKDNVTVGNSGKRSAASHRSSNSSAKMSEAFLEEEDGDETNGVATSSSSSSLVSKKRKSGDNVYEDEAGRLVFDLLEDEDDFEELVQEMVRESTGEFQDEANSDINASSSDDENDVVQPDDYEEYLKRGNPPDKLALYYLKELADKEKRNLELLQIKYTQQEELLRANPGLGSFLSASQSFEKSVVTATSPSKLEQIQEYSMIVGDSDDDGEDDYHLVSSHNQPTAQSRYHQKQIVVDLLESDEDDHVDALQTSVQMDTFDEYAKFQFQSAAAAPANTASYPTSGSFHAVAVTSSSQPVAMTSASSTVLEPVGFNKLKEAIMKRAVAKANGQQQSSSSSTPMQVNEVDSKPSEMDNSAEPRESEQNHLANDVNLVQEREDNDNKFPSSSSFVEGIAASTVASEAVRSSYIAAYHQLYGTESAESDKSLNDPNNQFKF